MFFIYFSLLYLGYKKRGEDGKKKGEARAMRPPGADLRCTRPALAADVPDTKETEMHGRGDREKEGERVKATKRRMRDS
jgi:hypothetical protein